VLFTSRRRHTRWPRDWSSDVCSSDLHAAVQFARAEGLLPAPEAAHAVRGAIDEALRCKSEGKRKTIVFNLCGHGHLDLSAYEAFLAGKLQDYEYPAEKVQEALKHLPKVKA